MRRWFRLAPRRSEGAAPARGGNEGPARAGDLVAALFGRTATRQLSAAQSAARAWFAANGDRERAHTTGVWLRKSGRAGTDPVLVVRLDSGLLAQELGTNKDLYLARLARAGVAVSDLRLEVGAPVSRTRKRTVAKEALPAPRNLSQAELDRVQRATAELPEGLREAAARAMRATMARQRPSG